jgi:putative SOS response-associated peptidase YedK
MRPIHHRRPIALGLDSCAAWLAAKTDAELDALLTHPPVAELVAEKVGFAVNNVRNDGPECLAPPSPEPAGGNEPQLSLGL